MFSATKTTLQGKTRRSSAKLDGIRSSLKYVIETKMVFSMSRSLTSTVTNPFGNLDQTLIVS